MVWFVLELLVLLGPRLVRSSSYCLRGCQPFSKLGDEFFQRFASRGSCQPGVELGYGGLLVLDQVLEVGGHHSFVLESDT
jgi:hypothetical protein